MTNSEEKVFSDSGGRIAFRMDPTQLLMTGILSSAQLKEITIFNFEYLEKCARAELELIEKTLSVLKNRESKD
jgi:hypothetical protein